jgi:DNA-binding MarR family transcriptional regulator
VVGLLNELEDRLLVTRRRDPADRRRHIVALSRRGEDELCVAYGRLRVVEDALFSALNAGERATLYDLVVRAAGVTSPPCDVAEEPPTCPV